MAEIYVKDGETTESVARRLLDQAAHPDHVVWQPRSGVDAGGVFVVPDDEVDDLMARVEAKRAADRRDTEVRIAAANARDARVADTGLTPAQLGFAANADAAAEDDDADDDEPDPLADEPGQAPPSADEEPKLSRAEQRRRDRRAAAEAAAQEAAAKSPAADETTAVPAEKTDKE